jgi:hypothetical protein
MRNSVAVLLLVFVGASGLIALLPGSSEAQGVARFRSVQISRATQGSGAASVEAWRTRVLLQYQNKTVGTGAWACVYVDKSTSVRECQATYILPRGRIQLAGEILSSASYQMTIVGGTGVYNDAGGVAVFVGPVSNRIVTFYLT